MTVRSPLYFLNGNLTAMSSGEVTQWRQKMQFIYSENPTAVLTQVANSGALIAAMSDTRTKAGATGQDATNFDLVAETADVATVTDSSIKLIVLSFSVSNKSNPLFFEIRLQRPVKALVAVTFFPAKTLVIKVAASFSGVSLESKRATVICFIPSSVKNVISSLVKRCPFLSMRPGRRVLCARIAPLALFTETVENFIRRSIYHAWLLSFRPELQ